jgi:hypothetical protein
VFTVEDFGGAGELIELLISVMRYRRYVDWDIPATDVSKAQPEDHLETPPEIQPETASVASDGTCRCSKQKTDVSKADYHSSVVAIPIAKDLSCRPLNSGGSDGTVPASRFRWMPSRPSDPAQSAQESENVTQAALPHGETS